MKKISVLAVSLFLSFNLLAASKKGVTVFVELTPAGSFEIQGKIKGNVHYKGGKYTAKNIIAKVKTFKTGLDLRDDHTKKKLENKDVIIEQAVGQNGKGTAVINVRGIKKKVPFVFKEAGKYIKVNFNLSLKDFNFSGLRYLSVGVKDKVKVEAIVPLQK